MKPPVSFARAARIAARMKHRRFKLWHAANKRLAATMADHWRRSFPRRKYALHKAREALPEAFQTEFNALKARCETTAARLEARRGKLLRVAAIRAAREPVPVDPAAWHCVDREDGGNHHTQGFGANKYARGALLARAEGLDSAGIPYHVRTAGTRYCPPAYGHGSGVSYSTFELWAPVTPDGYAHARALPPLPLVERVRRCWARGENPRVSMWWLPHGFEAQNGLDYFGGRKAPVSATA